MLMRLFLHLLSGLIFWSAAALQAQEMLSQDHVRIRWLAPDTLDRSTPTIIGLYFEVDPHWHVYWRNAGDSGAAPRFDLTSDHAEVGPAQWPFPSRLPVAHLTNLGYEGDVAYLFELTPHPQAGDRIQLHAELEWLVCQEDCIPGFGSLSLERPLGDAGRWTDHADLALLQHFQSRVPKGESTGGPWRISQARRPDNEPLVVTVTGPQGRTPELYPLDGEFLLAGRPAMERDGETYRFHMAVSGAAVTPAATGLVLVDGDSAWEFPAVPITSAGTADAEPQSLLWLVLMALGGGVVLNLMPCVFPVLSIKLFGLAQAGSHPLREGLLYSAGVMATFAALGGLFLALRAGGAAIGWGFQLQSPLVVLALILLFWALALSFMGFFEFGHRLMNLAGRAGGGSAFVTGMLAVFVAAPCTGPFMGVALGAAATLPAASAMAIFLGLGAGLALPFLWLAASPGLAARLPRPGPWMEQLRQLLAFPLFATVLWLLWVLDRLVGGEAWLTAALSLLAVAFALWLTRFRRPILTAAAWLLILLVAGGAVHQLNRAETRHPLVEEGLWRTYSAATLAEARQRGQAVFIDFTAAWCITCQVNKTLVLDTTAANNLLDEHNVLRLRADWTAQDEHITAALAELGRNSVPVYVFYPADRGSPQILPQILTLAMIRELFE